MSQHEFIVHWFLGDIDENTDLVLAGMILTCLYIVNCFLHFRCVKCKDFPEDPCPRFDNCKTPNKNLGSWDKVTCKECKEGYRPGEGDCKEGNYRMISEDPFTG